MNGTICAMKEMWDSMLRLDLERSRLEEEWREECNVKGLEIFYDMSNPTMVSHGCDEDCLDDCSERMPVGHYNTRPCKHSFHGCKGHVCNPGQSKITGLTTAGLSSWSI